MQFTSTDFVISIAVCLLKNRRMVGPVKRVPIYYTKLQNLIKWDFPVYCRDGDRGYDENLLAQTKGDN